MISLPFQNNTFFGVGPHGDTANVLNIQPVVPFSCSLNLLVLRSGLVQAASGEEGRWPKRHAS
jgi:hypothetical protein